MHQNPEKSKTQSDPCVWCYSGYRVDERPARFRFQSVIYQIRDIKRFERTPEEERFVVEVADGRIFLLRHSGDQEWNIAEIS